jgi:hypothetical protein
MRATRILLTALTLIAIILFVVLITLLFKPLVERERVAVTDELTQTSTPVVLPVTIEEPAPVSQDTSTATVSSGTDLYMEFPILEE